GRPAMERGARLRQHHRPGGALQQAGGEGLLECGHRAADAGAGHAHLARGGGEAPEPGDPLEDLQMVQVDLRHCSISCTELSAQEGYCIAARGANLTSWSARTASPDVMAPPAERSSRRARRWPQAIQS